MNINLFEDMEKCLNNSGLKHIGERILGHLPFKDKVTCRLVQKSCKNILDNLAPKVGIDDLLLNRVHSKIKKLSDQPAHGPKVVP